MKTSSAKAKARRLQDAVKKLLHQFLPDLENDDIKTATMGERGEDIKLSPAARAKIPFSFECKNQEKLNIWSALKQAERNAGDNVPVVIYKRNRSKIYITLEFEKLLELLYGDH